MGSRNRLAAQAPGNIGELKIVRGGWNAGSKPGSVRRPGCTHTQSMWGALGPMSGSSQPLEVLGSSQQCLHWGLTDRARSAFQKHPRAADSCLPQLPSRPGALAEAFLWQQGSCSAKARGSPELPGIDPAQSHCQPTKATENGPHPQLPQFLAGKF